MVDYADVLDDDYKGFSISQVIGKDGHRFDLFFARRGDGVSFRASSHENAKNLVDSWLKPVADADHI